MATVTAGGASRLNQGILVEGLPAHYTELYTRKGINRGAWAERV